MRKHLSLTQLFRSFGPDYLSQFEKRMPPSHRKAIRAIMACRTESLGGQMYLCSKCQKPHPAYHSCNNRHCPQCGMDKTEHWILKQFDRLLPLPYFFVTFTIPEQLRTAFRSQQTLLYNLLFQTSAQALKDVAANPRFVGGQIGFYGILQTWTRALLYHPHIHYIVAGAGLSNDGKRWLKIKNKKFLLHVMPLSRRFQHLFRQALANTPLYEFIPHSTWNKDWVVHCESAGYGQEIIKYLAPYIFKVAMTNQSKLVLEDGKVTFTYKENQTKEQKPCTISAFEFIRRFLQHVLPDGFMKVRYYGFLGSNQKSRVQKLKILIFQYLSKKEQAKFLTIHFEIRKRQMVCPKCGSALILLEKIPSTRGP